jgi:hypothetical protein
MIDISTTAVALVVTYLTKMADSVAEKAGEDTWEKMKALYGRIRDKFSSDQDEYAEKTLQRLEEQPANERRQSALAEVLKDKIEADQYFAEQVSLLARNATQDKKVVQFLTQVYGEATVGKIISIGQAHNVHID